MIKLTINNKLSTLNEYIKVERTNKYAASVLKKTNEVIIFSNIKSQKFKPLAALCYNVVIKWYNYRQDADNVEFCQKFIFDALQKFKMLKNDNKKNIKHKTHFHFMNKESKSQYCELYFFPNDIDYLKFIIECLITI